MYDIALHEYTTIYSSIFLLMDISIIQTFTFIENTILYILVNIPRL